MIQFPGDQYKQTPTTSGGLYGIGGVERYGTADGSVLTISNLNATNITTGTLDAARLAASYIIVGGGAADVNNNSTEIEPGKILISGDTQLADWRHGSNQTLIDGGDIYANSVTATQISATAIDGMVITGATLRTSSSGVGVIIDNSNTIKFRDSGGTVRTQLYDSAGDFYITAQYDVIMNCDRLHLDTGYLQVDGYGNIGGNFDVGGTLTVDKIDESGQGFVEIKDDLDVDGWFAAGGWGKFGDALNMTGHDINNCTGVNPPSSTYVGDENLLDIVRSMQNTIVPPIGGHGEKQLKWAEIDHSKLHPTLKKTWIEKDLNKETGEVEETEKEGYGLFELVLIQNRLLIDLASRLETLENKR